MENQTDNAEELEEIEDIYTIEEKLLNINASQVF